MPLVSVIIPAYNSGTRITETLDSVLNQTEKDLQIIVIDDGSSDDTEKRAKEHSRRIEVVRQPNQGIAGARNTGIERARGRYIAFLDHDDIWHPQKIATQLACLQSKPDIACAYSEFRRWEDGSAPSFSDEMLDPLAVDVSKSGWIYHLLVLDNPLFGTMIFKREVIETIGHFSSALPPSDDWDYVVRASRRFKFCKLRQVTTLYRVHAAQTSRRLPAINVSNEFRKTAIERFGYTGPDGTQVSTRKLRNLLYASDMGFGSEHYHNGDPAIAYRAFNNAIKHRPLNIRPYVLAFISLVKIFKK